MKSPVAIFFPNDENGKLMKMSADQIFFSESVSFIKVTNSVLGFVNRKSNILI